MATPPPIDPNTAKIIDRMKREGDLTRNTGTNSIKALNKNLDKVQGVLDSMTTALNAQTTVLSSMLALQEEANRMHRDAEARALANPSTTGSGGSGSGGDDDDSGPSNKKKGEGALSELWQSIIGGFAGGMGAGALSVATTVMRLGIAGVLAPVFAEFVTRVTTNTLDMIGLDKAGELNNFVSTAMGNGAFWGAIGLAINKRMGLVFGATGMGYSVMQQWAENLGIDQEDVIAGLDADTIAGIFGATGAWALSSFLTSPGFLTSARTRLGNIINGAKTRAISLAPHALSALRGGIAVGVAGAYLMYGDDVKTWLEEKGVPGGVADWGTDIAAFAAIGGSIGGLHGAIIGAVVGVAFAAGSAIIDWFKSQDNQVRDQAYAEAQAARDALRADSEAIANGEQERAIAASNAEAARAAQLYPDPAMRAAAQAETAANQAAMSQSNNNLLQSGQPLNTDQAMAIFDSIVGDAISESGFDALDPNADVNGLIQRIVQSDSMKLLKERMGPDFNISGLIQAASMTLRDDFKADNGEGLNTANTMMTFQYDLIAALEAAGMGHRTGTRGFKNFGPASVAVLHGREAVVPANTQAGRLLQGLYGDGGWDAVRPDLRRVDALNTVRSAGQSPVNVVFAPTSYAPNIQNHVSKGGTSVSNNTMVNAGGRSDLDFGMPKSAL